jgi:hypothetical protein
VVGGGVLLVVHFDVEREKHVIAQIISTHTRSVDVHGPCGSLRESEIFQNDPIEDER